MQVSERRTARLAGRRRPRAQLAHADAEIVEGLVNLRNPVRPWHVNRAGVKRVATWDGLHQLDDPDLNGEPWG